MGIFICNTGEFLKAGTGARLFGGKRDVSRVGGGASKADAGTERFHGVIERNRCLKGLTIGIKLPAGVADRDDEDDRDGNARDSAV